MAKNLGRKFATMSDDERRRFALEEEAGTNDHPAELVFDEPRNEGEEKVVRAVQKGSKRQRRSGSDPQ